MKFRKRPVVIDAIQYLGDKNKFKVAEFMKDKGEFTINFLGNETLEIHTLEGTMTASKNDWIIRGIGGELYPCKPDIFEGSYVKEEL
jgi:hypothetical protein